jgi:hypothetical protein
MDKEEEARSSGREQTDVADLASETSKKVAATSVNEGEGAVVLTTAMESNINGSAEPSELSSNSSDSIAEGSTKEAMADPKASEGDNTIEIEDASKGLPEEVEPNDDGEDDKSEEDKSPIKAARGKAEEKLKITLRKIRDGAEEQANHISKHASGLYWEEEGSG